jgi:hypothetical protein
MTISCLFLISSQICKLSSVSQLLWDECHSSVMFTRFQLIDHKSWITDLSCLAHLLMEQSSYMYHSIVTTEETIK